MIGNNFSYIGRLTADPELKEVNGSKVCNFTLASNVKKGEDVVGLFPDFVAWNAKAELICQYLKKGSKIMIDSHYDESFWEDQNGTKRKSIKFVVDNVLFLDNKNTTDNTSTSTNDTKASSTEEDDDLPF